jgi:hypothetical protein
MSEPTHIYHLIAFPTIYIQGRETLRKIEDDRDREARKAFASTEEGFYQSIGGTYRGSYLDKNRLIERVKSATDVYDICEGWYDYLLIETYFLNCIDGCLCDAPPFEESEMWFKFVKLSENEDGSGNYEYQHIPKPECLTGTCNFL